MDSVVSALKGLVRDYLIKQAMTKLTTIWVGFSWPVINPVISFVVGKIADWLLAETIVGLSLLWIQLDMSYEVATAEEAAKRLEDMLENPAKYSDEEQRKIEEDFDESTVNLIQLAIKRLG